MTFSLSSSPEMQTSLFPTAYSILSMNALQENVLTHYALGNPVTCRLLLHGFSDHYLIQTPEGRCVLRVYQAPRAMGRSWRTASEILYGVDLSLHLKRKGIAVSVPLARKDGTFLQSLQAAEGERYAVLFTYVEGEELSPASMDEAKSVFYGSGVAEMHNAADDFICSHPRLPLDMTLLVDTSLNAIEPVLEQQKEKWAYLVQLAQFVKERIDLFSHQGLEVGVCHGDAQGGNACMDVENKVTFFDFDNCGYGWRAYELAVFYWAAALGKSRLGKSDEEIERMWTAYLKG
jgi:Ser/Thr protein kinase RdoA (MazF antagonist)